jgi:hypothetical protein
MKAQKKKEKPDLRPTKTIKKNGYEFLLIEGKDRSLQGVPEPKFDGLRNWALKACKKIKK